MESSKGVAICCFVMLLLLKDHAAQSRTTPVNKMKTYVRSSEKKLRISEVSPKIYQQIIGSSNKSLSVASISSTQDQSDGLSRYYSVYQSDIDKRRFKYYGCTATLDIYGYPNLVNDQITSGMIWVVNADDDKKIEGIHVGWHVNPEHYMGDTKTHFFVSWTADNSDSTGCYNTNCPGFKLAPDAKLAPGSVLPTSTTQQKHTLTIKIAKEKDAWSLYAGVDGPATYIGNWPDSLFIGLADKATDINFGGFTQSPNNILSPPMGSGYLSESIGAATFKDVQFIDNQGNAYGIDWKLPSDVTEPMCYDIGDLENRQFAYGGPGGCTN